MMKAPISGINKENQIDISLFIKKGAEAPFGYGCSFVI
jgi:hypothetical protein